ELIERARTMWVACIAASVIGAEFGTSEHAIWNAARRYKFPSRYLKPGPKGRRAPIYYPTNRNDSDIPKEQRVSLLELSEDTCRWPVGDPGHPDFFYCGAVPLEGRPYCSAHCARAYNYVREKR